jgi:hypothetical protein
VSLYLKNILESSSHKSDKSQKETESSDGHTQKS